MRFLYVCPLLALAVLEAGFAGATETLYGTITVGPQQSRQAAPPKDACGAAKINIDWIFTDAGARAVYFSNLGDRSGSDAVFESLLAAQQHNKPARDSIVNCSYGRLVNFLLENHPEAFPTVENNDQRKDLVSCAQVAWSDNFEDQVGFFGEPPPLYHVIATVANNCGRRVSVGLCVRYPHSVAGSEEIERESRVIYSDGATNITFIDSSEYPDGEYWTGVNLCEYGAECVIPDCQ